MAGGTFNVKNAPYNATGDGTTDDTAAIKSAIAALVASAPTLANPGILYFPAGTYIVAVTTASHLNLYSHMHVQGVSATTATIKIKPSNGIFTAIFWNATPGTDIVDVRFDTLGFDTNIANNSAATIDSTITGTDQQCIYIDAGQDLHVENCKFVGSGIWEVSFNGASIDNCTLSNNTVTFVFATVQGSDYDNTCFYIDGTNYKINDNTFTTTIGRARACIETHGGAKTDNSGGSECARNVSTNFQTIINVVNQYAAIAGQLSTIDIHDNTCNAAIQPIRMQPITPGNMKGITIRNNILHITQIPHLGNDTYGIGSFFDPSANHGSLSNVTITGNHIDFQDDGAGSAAYPTFDCGGISLHHISGGDTFLISNNTITNCPGPGIRVGLEVDPLSWNAWTGTRDFSNCTISGNIIKNCGQNLGFPAGQYRSGIFICSSCTNMTIVGNAINDTWTTQRMNAPMVMTGAFPGLVANSNLFGRPTS